MHFPTAINSTALDSKRNFAVAVSQKQNTIKYFTLDELRQILSLVNKEYDYVSWFLCLALSRTGARISELLQVKVSDIDFTAKVIKVITLKRRQKGDKKANNPLRYIPIQSDFVGAIGEWIARQELSKNDYLFTFGRKMAHIRIKKLCKAAYMDEERSHPHTFRHSYAIVNLIQGVPVTVLAEWLGHANILNTLIYTRIIAQHSQGFAEQVQW